jgi:hypothetical protein
LRVGLEAKSSGTFPFFFVKCHGRCFPLYFCTFVETFLFWLQLKDEFYFPSNDDTIKFHIPETAMERSMNILQTHRLTWSVSFDFSRPNRPQFFSFPARTGGFTFSSLENFIKNERKKRMNFTIIISLLLVSGVSLSMAD